MKPDGIRQCGNRLRITSHKMPSRRCPRASVIPQISRFLRARQIESLPRIEADDDDLKLFARVERDVLQALYQSIQLLIAEHRERVINERQYYWFRITIFA